MARLSPQRRRVKTPFWGVSVSRLIVSRSWMRFAGPDDAESKMSASRWVPGTWITVELAETDELAYLSIGALTSIAWIAFIPTHGCVPASRACKHIAPVLCAFPGSDDGNLPVGRGRCPKMEYRKWRAILGCVSCLSALQIPVALRSYCRCSRSTMRGSMEKVTALETSGRRLGQCFSK